MNATLAETSTSQGVGHEISTSYDPPEESKEDSSDRMMRMFEQEMGLGPSLGAHIPSFIAEGLAQLRSAPAGHFDTKEPVKKEFSEARKENSQPDEGEADNFVATIEEKKEAEANVYKKQKDDGRINGQG